MSEHTAQQAAADALAKHAKLVRERDKIQEKIWRLQDRKQELAEQVEAAHKELVKARQACREEDYAAKEAAWDALAAQRVTRWSSRWWASEGWRELDKAVGWGDAFRSQRQRCPLLVAVFAELSPRDQFVLELWYGIGTERVTTYADLAKVLPDLYRWQEGITNTQAKRVLLHALHMLGRKLAEFDRNPWNRLDLTSNLR